MRRAVERTVPFGLIVGTLAICWYATACHHPETCKPPANLAPWYRNKTQPSVLDMLAKLRRVIIATQFRQTDPLPPTPAEINLLLLPGKTRRHSCESREDHRHLKSGKFRRHASHVVLRSHATRLLNADGI